MLKLKTIKNKGDGKYEIIFKGFRGSSIGSSKYNVNLGKREKGRQ
jgi:hypothetical protein